MTDKPHSATVADAAMQLVRWFEAEIVALGYRNEIVTGDVVQSILDKMHERFMDGAPGDPVQVEFLFEAVKEEAIRIILERGGITPPTPLAN